MLNPCNLHSSLFWTAIIGIWDFSTIAIASQCHTLPLRADEGEKIQTASTELLKLNIKCHWQAQAQANSLSSLKGGRRHAQRHKGPGGTCTRISGTFFLNKKKAEKKWLPGLTSCQRARNSNLRGSFGKNKVEADAAEDNCPGK